MILWYVRHCHMIGSENTGFLMDELTIQTRDSLIGKAKRLALANTSCRLVQRIYRQYITAWIDHNVHDRWHFSVYPDEQHCRPDRFLLTRYHCKKVSGRKRTSSRLISVHFWLNLQVLDYSKSGWRTFANIWCLNVYDSYYGSTAPHNCK